MDKIVNRFFESLLILGILLLASPSIAGNSEIKTHAAPSGFKDFQVVFSFSNLEKISPCVSVFNFPNSSGSNGKLVAFLGVSGGLIDPSYSSIVKARAAEPVFQTSKEFDASTGVVRLNNFDSDKKLISWTDFDKNQDILTTAIISKEGKFLSVMVQNLVAGKNSVFAQPRAKVPVKGDLALLPVEIFQESNGNSTDFLDTRKSLRGLGIRILEFLSK